MDNLSLLVILPEYGHETACPMLRVPTGQRGTRATKKVADPGQPPCG